MSNWTEGIVALVVVMAFGAALFLYNGDTGAGGEEPSTEPVEFDEDAAARGRVLAEGTGCLQCHTVDGSDGSGPTFEGVAGSDRSLASGETVFADDSYLFNSIVDPSAQIVSGFDAIMPGDYEETLTEAEIEDLVEYIKSLAA